MKRWIFWTFDRGSFQYDGLCALILILMFAIPSSVFKDRPEWMRVPESAVRQSVDGDGIGVYTVTVEGEQPDEDSALASLATYLGEESGEGTLDVFRSEAVQNTRGQIVAYAFWLR
jgi:hypothetical protein